MELKGAGAFTFALIVISIFLIAVLTAWAIVEVYSLIDTSRAGLELIASLRKMQGSTYNLLIAENLDIAYLKWEDAAAEYRDSLSRFHGSSKLEMLIKDQSVMMYFKAFTILSERALASIETIHRDYEELSGLTAGDNTGVSVLLTYRGDESVTDIVSRFREIGNYFSSSYEATITPMVALIEQESRKTQRSVLGVFIFLFFVIMVLAGLFSLHLRMNEQKRKEEIMQMEIQKNKFELLELFAGGLAHDFNNYFSTILGNISLAKEIAAGNPELLEMLGDVEYASAQAAGLTRQFMVFAKKGVSHKTTVDVAKVLKNTAGFILRGSSISWTLDFQEGLFPVKMDESQFSEVINNLLINAKQATQREGRVRISARNVSFGKKNSHGYAPGDYVEVVIRDNGSGIPESIRYDVINPFFTTKKTGSGLGLAVCYSIMQKNHGYIDFDSIEGAGTTFHLFLPRAADRVPAVNEKAVDP
ncbi:MAG: hypothetical protein JXB03_02085 [Spirochaetales bacterium]|nr:hypothetical protein [Spirochaetales bacterium]